MPNLPFISDENFETHVAQTISKYNEALASIDLRKFNSNIIDPIKLLFDKNVFNRTFDEVIQLEITRQRDKTNNNAIGYFHQNIFRYIDNCRVPTEGWDVIFTRPDGRRIFAELKNKHNTMNSASSQRTYIKMQSTILENPNNECYLVETLAPESRNIVWGCSVNGEHIRNEHIRRVSMDRFYALVTGVPSAFFLMCEQLPRTIDLLIAQGDVVTAADDTVIQELHELNPDTLKALYILAFRTYEGFGNI